MSEPLAYSVKEAAEMLAIGRTTLYRLMAEGHLASITVGRRRLITETDLEAFLASCRVPQSGWGSGFSTGEHHG